MEFINLTPHTIVIKTETKEKKIDPSGTVARVAVEEKEAGEIEGIPVIKRGFKEVEGLPEPKDGVVYLVSSLVLSAVKGRGDVFAPDTGNTAIRNEQGQIEAVTRLVSAGEL